MPASPPGDLASLSAQVIHFREERDWKPFHNPKDVAISLVLEATEYLELFQWKDPASAARVPRKRAAEELADTLYWVLLAAHDQGIDLVAALEEKLRDNAAKYPVAKSRGSAAKYTEL
jgi:NTP pyrophosphatase (non-canonical NTP hydrolase)